MRRGGFALLLLSVGIGVGGAAAGAQDLGCDEVVRDPGSALDDRIAVESTAADLAATHGLRVRVRVEQSLDGGVDARMAQLDRIGDYLSGSRLRDGVYPLGFLSRSG